MATDNIKKLATIMSQGLGYNEELKIQFHRVGKLVCKQIADAMGLAKEYYEIRSNLGGIAVSGEVTLHTDSIYIQFSERCCGLLEIMYRKVSSRKDSGGGNNNWMEIDELVEDFDKAIYKFTNVILNASVTFVSPF